MLETTRYRAMYWDMHDEEYKGSDRELKEIIEFMQAADEPRRDACILGEMRDMDIVRNPEHKRRLSAID